jgi:hypothetical protein
MKLYNQDRLCHSNPFRFARGKLREASVSPETEILRCAQNDKAVVGR